MAEIFQKKGLHHQQQLRRFFCDNSLTAAQQEFLREIVEYVRANGDVTRPRPGADIPLHSN